jgi:hypothetical protein
MTDPSLDYYRELLSLSAGVAAQLKQALAGIIHPTALAAPTGLNGECYRQMVTGLHGAAEAPARDTIQSQLAGLSAACQGCVPFFLRQRSALDKKQDVVTGARFELPFRDFLRNHGLDAFLANDIDMDLPDVGVRNSAGQVRALLELKYHNAPFIRARQFVGADTECYDGSLTVDVGKCRKQFAKATTIYPGAAILLVHWVDFPCLKCILWDKMETALGEVVYERRHRSGDYREGYQVGWTKKTYHRVRYLRDFASLLETLREHAS